jgi:hypothetical protein
MQRLVEQQVADLGECVSVTLTATGQAFMVPRHFIALHGLKAPDLPALAELYGFEEVRDGMSKCDIVAATHVFYRGVMHRIASKWGVTVGERLAKPSQGGVGCVTESGERISMWDAEGYFQESREEVFMSMWVVYYNPRDFPGKYVARRHDVLRGPTPSRASSEYFTADTLEEIQSRIPPGMYRMNRYEDDDPNIVETWI